MKASIQVPREGAWPQDGIHVNSTESDGPVVVAMVLSLMPADDWFYHLKKTKNLRF